MFSCHPPTLYMRPFAVPLPTLCHLFCSLTSPPQSGSGHPSEPSPSTSGSQSPTRIIRAAKLALHRNPRCYPTLELLSSCLKFALNVFKLLLIGQQKSAHQLATPDRIEYIACHTDCYLCPSLDFAHVADVVERRKANVQIALTHYLQNIKRAYFWHWSYSPLWRSAESSSDLSEFSHAPKMMSWSSLAVPLHSTIGVGRLRKVSLITSSPDVNLITGILVNAPQPQYFIDSYSNLFALRRFGQICPRFAE